MSALLEIRLPAVEFQSVGHFLRGVFILFNPFDYDFTLLLRLWETCFSELMEFGLFHPS